MTTPPLSKEAKIAAGLALGSSFLCLFVSFFLFTHLHNRSSLTATPPDTCPAGFDCTGPVQEDAYGNRWRSVQTLATIRNIAISATSTGYAVETEVIGGGCIGFNVFSSSTTPTASVTILASDLQVLRSVDSRSPTCTSDIRYERKVITFPTTIGIKEIQINNIPFSVATLPLQWKNPAITF